MTSTFPGGTGFRQYNDCCDGRSLLLSTQPYDWLTPKTARLFVIFYHGTAPLRIALSLSKCYTPATTITIGASLKAAQRAIVDYLAGRYAEYLADLRDMVSIDCGSQQKEGVDRIGVMMRQRLEGLGCQVVTHHQEQLGDNLVATMAGKGRLRVLLIGHMDTVYPSGTAQARPFVIRGRRAYGAGVHDMKVGLLSGYYAMAALRAVGWEEFAQITYICNGDEEVGSPSSRPLIEREAARADAVLVLEGARAGGRVVTARKGIGSYEVQVYGQAAHTGVALHNGSSAILELAHKVVALHGLNKRPDGPLVTVSMISGGVAANVVPPTAAARVDVRVGSHDQLHRLEETFRQLVETASVRGTKTVIRGGLSRPPMEKTAGVSRLFALAQEAAAELGFALHDIESNGGSDAVFAAALGVPTLDGLGPDGGGPHSDQEYVELESIVPRTAMLARLIQLLALA